ncbi:MAG: DNA polymerase III subunit gamma/tau, partial [Butyricicoccus pullicaecorum]|nr:DNA polymerase III subunit gamma/tau [Butyricicoccus pullicaecorum]
AYESGRDLVGVMDQLLSLIRDMLLVKTANGDVASLISPTYTKAQLCALGEGLAPTELIAYSRILQDAIGRMKSASNRRVEAEFSIIRLCTMGGEVYDSLEGRVEALEERVRHGVPVIAAAAPADTVQPVAAAPKAEEPTNSEAPRTAWSGWEQVLERANGIINMGALTCLQISSHAERDGEQILVFCEDDVTAGLAKAQPTIDRLSEIAAAVAGTAVRVKILEPNQKLHPQSKAASDEILERAKEFDIHVTEF